MATINFSDYKPLKIVDSDKFVIGIVVSEWNNFATFKLRDGALELLKKEGIKEENIKIYYVPGAFELSFATMQLCKSNLFDAVIAIGCIIRGETSHFDYVCSAVSQGIKDCNTKTDTPAIFCILTDNNKYQSMERSGGVLGNKGTEAGIAALKMINFNKNLKK